MRHNKKHLKISRKKEHRLAMLANMSVSLIKHKRIFTTLAKAKLLRKYIEPLLTRAKKDTTHNRRHVFSFLKNKEAIKILFNEIAQKIANRPGGYTRILRVGNRKGDNAKMCLIELVDFNPYIDQENLQAQKKQTIKKVRRGGKKKKSPTTQTATTT